MVFVVSDVAIEYPVRAECVCSQLHMRRCRPLEQALPLAELSLALCSVGGSSIVVDIVAN
jgi:hypothetical protein